VRNRFDPKLRIIALAVAPVLLVAAPGSVILAGYSVPPDLSGAWSASVVAGGKTIATAAVTLDAQGAFAGGGTDQDGDYFSVNGQIAQVGKTCSGTFSTDSSSAGVQTFSLVGKANGSGTKMKWKAVELTGVDPGSKGKIRLTRVP
jgi:hypothetical protein